MKKVIYTSLTKGYDDLPQYDVIDPEFDYICFSNDYPDKTKIGQWEIRHIPYHSKDSVRLSRFAKLMPHVVLPEYEYSVWLDANIVILSREIYEAFDVRMSEGGVWYGIKHPKFDCLYEDAIECLVAAKEKYHNIMPQIRFLREDGFPPHYGLYENNVIIRKHNSREVREVDEMWWDLFQRFSKRDQLSMSYVMWKRQFRVAGFVFQSEQNTHNMSGIKFIIHKQPCLLKRVRRKLTSWHNRILLAVCEE